MIGRIFFILKLAAITCCLVLITFTTFQFITLSNYWGNDSFRLIASAELNNNVQNYCVLETYTGSIREIVYQNEEEKIGFVIASRNDERVFNKIIMLTDIAEKADISIDNVRVSKEALLKQTTSLAYGNNVYVELCIRSDDMGKVNRVITILINTFQTIDPDE